MIHLNKIADAFDDSCFRKAVGVDGKRTVEAETFLGPVALRSAMDGLLGTNTI